MKPVIKFQDLATQQIYSSYFIKITFQSPPCNERLMFFQHEPHKKPSSALCCKNIGDENPNVKIIDNTINVL